jgi:hypothetical protein
LVFRAGAVVAHLAIFDYSDDAPPASEANTLGATMRDRIAAVVDSGSAGFGATIQRLDGDEIVTYYDWYRRRDGATSRDYGETNTAFQTALDYQDEIELTDSYWLNQGIPGETADDPFYSYLATLRRFADPDAAEEWATEFPAEFAANPTGNYSDVEIVADADTIGDVSTFLSFTFNRSDGTVATGFVSFFVVDDVVAEVQLNGVPAVSAAAVEALARDQARCLTDGICQPWVAPPDDLAAEPAVVEPLEIALDEVDDSGVRGDATLEPVDDGATAELALANGEEGMIAVVQAGDCDDLEPNPVSDLVALDDDGEATLEIALTLPDLLADDHAIAVYASADDLDEPPIACGEIARTRPRRPL